MILKNPANLTSRGWVYGDEEEKVRQVNHSGYVYFWVCIMCMHIAVHIDLGEMCTLPRTLIWGKRVHCRAYCSMKESEALEGGAKPLAQVLWLLS